MNKQCERENIVNRNGSRCDTVFGSMGGFPNGEKNNESS